MGNGVNIIQINENIKSNSSPYKIKKALNKIGVFPMILTLESAVDDPDLKVLKRGLLYKIQTKIHYFFDRLEYQRKYSYKDGFPFSYQHVGIDVSQIDEVKSADIIILHWVCGGFITAQIIKKLCDMGKKVIWVCHDSWPFTGGCHVRMGCDRFMNACGKCPMLQSEVCHDWSFAQLSIKKRFINPDKITIVSPSKWMDGNVAKSELFKKSRHLVIPNPIDVKKYSGRKKDVLRKRYAIANGKKVILFGAVNATSTPYKGFSYLISALKEFSEMIDNHNDYAIVVFGASSGNGIEGVPFDFHYLGRLSEEQMIDAYSLSDVYVTPTLDDNLPNTVMESLACGLPVVAFDTGGVSDMVIHKNNGYLARYKDSTDLAYGIKWVFDYNNNNILGFNGRESIVGKFDEVTIAKEYEKLFNSLLNK